MWTDEQIKGKMLHKLTRKGKFEHSHTALENLAKSFPPEMKGRAKEKNKVPHYWREYFGKREESSKTTKSPLLEELESKYLSKQSFTGLYSKPTRLILRGKSKKEEKQFWENKLEKLNKKCEIVTAEEDKKRYKEAINYIEKQLEEFE